MNSKITPNQSILNEDNLRICDYEEYYLIKEKIGYKFIIGKRSNDIIIKCKNYELTLNNNDLPILIKSILNTIDDAFLFIINIFEENKVIIKDIVINKTITLLLNIYIYNRPKVIEIILLYNKKSNKDLMINELIKNYNSNLKKNISYLINEINILKKEVNQLKKYKINNNEIQINNNKGNEINNNIVKELNENIINKYNNNEYKKKINYKFKKEPQNLKYKLDITNTNYSYGLNDIFEIFISYKDNKEYLISPNKNNCNLEIFTLLNNKIILSLKGHYNDIRTIRYYINTKNNNEYLISGDDNKIVIIWDITNNYNIKYHIDTKYGGNIYSCLLIFPYNYIITSTSNTSDDIENSSIKIYSLNNGNYVKYLNNTNNNEIYYLLSWTIKRIINFILFNFHTKN